MTSLHAARFVQYTAPAKMRTFRDNRAAEFEACIRQVLPNWKRPAGRPSHIWLRAIEADLGPLNFGLATAWRKATTRDEWRHIVDTAMLQRSAL